MPPPPPLTDSAAPGGVECGEGGSRPQRGGGCLCCRRAVAQHILTPSLPPPPPPPHITFIQVCFELTGRQGTRRTCVRFLSVSAAARPGPPDFLSEEPHWSTPAAERFLHVNSSCPCILYDERTQTQRKRMTTAYLTSDTVHTVNVTPRVPTKHLVALQCNLFTLGPVCWMMPPCTESVWSMWDVTVHVHVRQRAMLLSCPRAGFVQFFLHMCFCRQKKKQMFLQDSGFCSCRVVGDRERNINQKHVSLLNEDRSRVRRVGHLASSA
ncbi:hypothetical protein INR49_003985 [Caranx melampygus]|nr:hypothetical protein INR49_003985 [Caranx melampygus]